MAMSLSALDTAQKIPNVGRKEESDGMKFQLCPGRGFLLATEIQKCPLNPLCAATERGKTWGTGNGYSFIFMGNFVPFH